MPPWRGVSGGFCGGASRGDTYRVDRVGGRDHVDHPEVNVGFVGQIHSDAFDGTVGRLSELLGPVSMFQCSEMGSIELTFMIRLFAEAMVVYIEPHARL